MISDINTSICKLYVEVKAQASFKTEIIRRVSGKNVEVQML